MTRSALALAATLAMVAHGEAPDAGVAKPKVAILYFTPSTRNDELMAFAKGIASGMPLAAMVTRAEIMESWSIGAHGSTYGGNPLAMAVGSAVFDVAVVHVVPPSDEYWTA